MNEEKLYKIPSFKREYLADMGSTIREYRKQHYITQENLGSLIGVQKAQVCKIESGKNLTVETIAKVFHALGARIRIKIETQNTPQQRRQKVEHIVSCVSLFADMHSLTQRQAYNYLYRFGGMDFLDSYFESNSSFVADVAVDKVYMVCKQNGGKI